MYYSTPSFARLPLKVLRENVFLARVKV
jgi:hypothetical protein